MKKQKANGCKRLAYREFGAPFLPTVVKMMDIPHELVMYSNLNVQMAIVRSE